jgi:spermidine synthase
MAPHQAPLGLVVLFAGISTMAVEMLAARLIAPFYGASLLVWMAILTSILIALTAGYYWGGRRADRDPRVEPLATTLTIASALLSIGPLLAVFLLQHVNHADSALDRAIGFLPAQLVGALTSLFILVLPVALLGSVGPYVIRLRTKDPLLAGTRAGSILGLSTIGSIVGTYLPALVGIPYLKTLGSFLALAAVVGTAAMLISPMGPRRLLAAGIAFVLPFALHFARPTYMRPGQGIIFEGESVYNTVQIKQQQVHEPGRQPYSRVMLILNEGYAVHSITTDDTAWSYPLVGSVWDYMGLLPTLTQPEGKQLDVAIVGLAGGTVARELIAFFKGIYDVHIEGAEIDPMIISLAKDYFRLPPEVDAHAQDGRAFLARSKKEYDLIVTDAYRQPYIPFHLTTQEYFTIVRSRLKPRGICSINVGSTSPKEELLSKILATMESVFAEVYIFEVPRITPLFANYLVIASKEKGVIKPPNDQSRPLARHVADRYPAAPVQEVLNVWSANLKVSVGTQAPVLTDDRADVENLVHSMIWHALTDPGLNINELDH